MTIDSKYFEAVNFYRPQTKFAKVMFLQVSVILSTGGGMCGCSGGGCVVAPRGGHAWLPGGHVWLLLGGMHGCSRRVCVIAPGGACVAARGCAWLLWGGGHAWFF